jgi:hypothetical protein
VLPPWAPWMDSPVRDSVRLQPTERLSS